jgi:membrane protein
MIRFNVLKFKLSFRDLGSIVIKTIKKVIDDDCLGLATQISYHFTFSVVPWLIFLAILIGYLGSYMNYPMELNSLLTTFLPSEPSLMIQDKLSELISHNSPGLMSFSVILMLWSSSHVVNSLTNGLDKAYGQRRKHAFLINRLYSMIVILLSGLLVLLSFAILVFGPAIASHISSTLGLDKHHASLSLLWGVARWPLAFIILSLLLTLIYRFLPSKKHPFLMLWQGSMLAVLLWMGLSVSLGFYLQYSPGFSRMYGSLGVLISVLVWVHLSSFILLAGAEFNSVLEAHLKEKQQRT